MNARNHSRSLVVRCPSSRCLGISGTSPKYKPCSACQSLYALQSDTMVSVIRRLAIFRKAWFAARLPMALACERNRLAILRSSSPRDRRDLGTDLPPRPLVHMRSPQAVFRATWPPGLLRRAGVETTEDGVVRPDVCHGGPNKFFAALVCRACARR